MRYSTHLIQTCLETSPGGVQLHLLHPDELGEDAEQLQVAGGSYIVVSRQLGQEALGVGVYRLVDLLTHDHLHTEGE